MNSIFIALNNIRRLMREVHAIVFLLIFPILGGIWAVVLVSFYDVTEVGINLDLSSNNRLYKVITETGKFSLNYYNENDILKKLNNKELDIGVIIPENYENLIHQNKKLNIKVVSLKNNSNVIQVRMIIEEYMQSALLGKSSSGNQFLINAKNNIPGQRSTMGFMLLFILLFSGSGIELILEDKKYRTYMRTFCAPVKSHEYILGNLLSNILLGTLQILIFLTVTKFIFKFDWKVPLFNIFIILFTFLACSIGISIGLIGFIKNDKLYTLANAMFSLFTCFIGGAFFSPGLMGETLDKAANFLPQKWAMLAYEKLVDGSSIADVQMNFWIILLFGAVFATFGIKMLNPSEDEL